MEYFIGTIVTPKTQCEAIKIHDYIQNLVTYSLQEIKPNSFGRHCERLSYNSYTNVFNYILVKELSEMNYVRTFQEKANHNLDVTVAKQEICHLQGNKLCVRRCGLCILVGTQLTHLYLTSQGHLALSAL